MPPELPPLRLRAPNPNSSWRYEAFVVYDAANQALREDIDSIAEHLTDNGVRTMKSLNEPGSLKSGYALAMSTTAEAMVSTGITVIFVTCDLLAKASGAKGAGKHDACAVEVGTALTIATVHIGILACLRALRIRVDGGLAGAGCLYGRDGGPSGYASRSPFTHDLGEFDL